jgi:hypothetical protein
LENIFYLTYIANDPSVGDIIARLIYAGGDTAVLSSATYISKVPHSLRFRSNEACQRVVVVVKSCRPKGKCHCPRVVRCHGAASPKSVVKAA